jgi:UDP-glucose 4-epimerase
MGSASWRYATSTRPEPTLTETHLIPLVLFAAMGREPSIKIFGNEYPFAMDTLPSVCGCSFAVR